MTAVAFRASPDPTNVSAIGMLEFRPYYATDATTFTLVSAARRLTPQQRMERCVAVTVGTSFPQVVLKQATQFQPPRMRYMYERHTAPPTHHRHPHHHHSLIELFFLSCTSVCLHADCVTCASTRFWPITSSSTGL